MYSCIYMIGIVMVPVYAGVIYDIALSGTVSKSFVMVRVYKGRINGVPIWYGIHIWYGMV